MLNILSVQSSARGQGSITRQLSETIIGRLRAAHGEVEVTTREADGSVPPVTTAWVAGAFKPADARSPKEAEALRISDELVAELQAADILVIGAPIYNFAVPGTLKAWIDQVCRAGVTFRYAESGPVGLLENKKAIVVVASGGTGVGTPVDFHTPFMRHVLGFIGIHDVEFVAADMLMRDEDAAMSRASDAMEAIAA